MIEKFNVVRAKKYTSNNEEKTLWLNIGMITKFNNGNQILELNDRSEVYQIFSFNKERVNTSGETLRNDTQKQVLEVPNNYPNDSEIKVEDIPF